LNPRRTKPPETVFETAAFDRSATPPRSRDGQRNRVAHAISRRLPPEPGSAPAGGEARAATAQRRKKGAVRGKHGFPRKSEPRRRRGEREAEKEGFEPSRQGCTPPNALAGRRLQPLGHFSGDERVAHPPFASRANHPSGAWRKQGPKHMLKRPASPSNPPASRRPSAVSQAGFAVSTGRFRCLADELPTDRVEAEARAKPAPPPWSASQASALARPYLTA
jgi:hypothetical protein